MLKLLIVGQTPPPYHGQAIMIDRLVNADFAVIEVMHVRMGFSSGIESVGKFNFVKLFELFRVVAAIYWSRLVNKADHLYYPPAGPNLVPVMRDIFILVTCRWLFKKTIFHFHAGGVSEIYATLPILLKPLFRLAYMKPDLSIYMSSFNPRDDVAFKSRKSIEVPHGIPDVVRYQRGEISTALSDTTIQILYVGLVCRSKGVFDLIDALRLMQERKLKFHCNVIGEVESADFREQLVRRVAEAGIAESISFLGEKTGAEKHQFFALADIFCFPTFYESETFGVVLVEAMQHELPVVATKWRGVQSIVREGETGFMVPINAPEILAEKLIELLKDENLRARMGKTGRLIYEQEYTLDKWVKAMENAITTSCAL